MPAYWAVARSVPHQDRLAVECVGLAGYETFVPKIRVRVGAQWRTTPLFVGYFFVRIVDQWRVLERTMGVSSVVKGGATPSRCPDEKIAKLIGRADPDGVIRLGGRSLASSPAHVFTRGAPVTIAGGPLVGFTGLYAGQTARERELILINLLGRETPVTIASGLVVPAQ
jgi:transcription antitermination factor NusG